MDLTFYENNVVRVLYENGRPANTAVVSIIDIAELFKDVDMKKKPELLEPGTIFSFQQGPKRTVGYFVPAQKRELKFGNETLVIPTPGLIFMTEGDSHNVYAVKESEIRAETKLFNAPFPNVHRDGSICTGNAVFPDNGNNMKGVVSAFFESKFNHDLVQDKSKMHPTNIVCLLKKIIGAEEYPSADLIECDWGAKYVGDFLKLKHHSYQN